MRENPLAVPTSTHGWRMDTPQDLLHARRARKAGAHYALTIIREAKRAGIPLSLAFALVEHESSFRNVYGHDPVANRAPKGGKVTRTNYLGTYLPDRHANRGMQGVGLTQLTWYEFQDQADKLGGCWVPRNQIRVAFARLRDLTREYGQRGALRRYNGAGTAAQVYAETVIGLQRKWHGVLTGGK